MFPYNCSLPCGSSLAASCKLPPDSIIPIFKSGDKSLISNYMQTNLSSMLDLQSSVYDKVFDYWPISKSQFGFLRHHSCLLDFSVMR